MRFACTELVYARFERRGEGVVRNNVFVEAISVATVEKACMCREKIHYGSVIKKKHTSWRMGNKPCPKLHYVLYISRFQTKNAVL